MVAVQELRCAGRGRCGVFQETGGESGDLIGACRRGENEAGRPKGRGRAKSPVREASGAFYKSLYIKDLCPEHSIGAQNYCFVVQTVARTL